MSSCRHEFDNPGSQENRRSPGARPVLRIGASDMNYPDSDNRELIAKRFAATGGRSTFTLISDAHLQTYGAYRSVPNGGIGNIGKSEMLYVYSPT
jgi:hypothetical protein